MRVFLFDLVHYDERLDQHKIDGVLPYPLGKSYFRPEVGVRTYAEHLDAWAEMERVGFDGVAFNEHHATPYGLMNSPNLLAAAASQRTAKLKLLIYGNLLPLHEPLRLAEELAMLDCLSNGRLICGIARGAPREYRVYNVPMSESRGRFEECFEVMRRAWTEESFSFDGQFYHYKDIACWPRPVQQPHPPVWVPVTGSKETIDWAAKHNLGITPGAGGPARDDIIRQYARGLAAAGHRLTPDHLNVTVDAYVADSKEQAIAEYGPCVRYFMDTLFNYDNVARTDIQQGYYSKEAYDYLRPDLREQVANARWRIGNAPVDISRLAEFSAWGTADEVIARVIDVAEAAGANTIQLSCNRGSMPQALFLNQIRRLGKEVLPALQAHRVARVKVAEDVGAS